MMEEAVVEDRAGETSNLITTVPVQMVSEARVEVVSKPVVSMTPVNMTMTPVAMTPVTMTTNGVPQDLITAQYINIHRVPDQLNKVLVSDAISGELLTHHVDLSTAADFTQHSVTTQYYDTDDLLTHDLTEEDRRLAAELVAVQLKHQQQQQQHHQAQQTSQILPASVASLGAVQTVSMDRPTISAAIVTSYIQAVEEEVVHQHLLQQQQENNDRCIMKIYQQQPTAHDLQQVLNRQQQQQTQPLPPLKKVLSSQSPMVLRNKYPSASTVMVELPHTPISNATGVTSDGSTVKLEPINKTNQPIAVPTTVQPAVTSSPVQSSHSQGQLTEDVDSDYDAESDTRPSRRSLPHKKRIPRKLKAPPSRSIHTKCYKCNKCGESFTTQTAFSSHKLLHMAPTKQRPCINNVSTMFSCELCSKQFVSQLKFFEHLKQHYEPINCVAGGDNDSDGINLTNLTINGVNSSGNTLPELTPAPIVATCLSPLPATQQQQTSSATPHTIVTVTSSSAQLQVSSQQQPDIVSMEPAVLPDTATPPLSHPTISGAFSIKDELGQGVVKEEIVTSTGVACNQCGETFRKAKALDAHLATAHPPRQEEIEEFSEPEDMMEGISIRHVVNISNVMSGDEGECGVDENCDSAVVDGKIKWRYHEDQDLGMDLQDIRCLPLPTTTSVNHHHTQVAQHDHSVATPDSILPDDNSNNVPNEEDVDDPSPVVNNRIITRTMTNINSNSNSSSNSNTNNNNNSANISSLSSANNICIGNSSGRKKQLSCPECDRKFNHRNSLLYHVKTHSGVRLHQCEVCGKSFFSTSALKVHMRLHSGDKPYKCEFCGRHFRQWGDLKYHVTSLHSDQKQFQCEYCGKDFARKYSLIVHRRIHTGEKNYKCEFCVKTFRASSYLQNHRRIHTGEKPHSCDVCGKPFRVRSDMKRHRQTHSRERPISRSASVVAVINPEDQEEEDDDDDNSAGTGDGESILPDNAMATPLNLNIRQSDSNDGITYSRAAASLEREGNTLYVWIPAQPETKLFSDE